MFVNSSSLNAFNVATPDVRTSNNAGPKPAAQQTEQPQTEKALKAPEENEQTSKELERQQQQSYDPKGRLYAEGSRGNSLDILA